MIATVRERESFYALGHGSAGGIFLLQVAVASGFARLFVGQSKPIVFPGSVAARGGCRRVSSGRLTHVQVRFLWPRRVEVRCIGTSLNTSDLGTQYFDKQRRAALLSMMPLTQFVGHGRAVETGALGREACSLRRTELR